MNNENSKSLSSVTGSFAAIIPDTPIVSIAGSTLSEITTTTTSTTTTPTPMSSEPTKANLLIPEQMSDAVAESDGSVSALSGASANNTNSSGIFKKDLSAPIRQKLQDTESKDCESWGEERLTDLDDKCLKNLLEEAYSYKNPRDKENKSERFLHLLKEAENETEDQTISFKALASQFSRNSTSSNSSNNHHQHKQGGSLQDLVNTVHNESLLTRYNHNSRQKKYSVSVSSRSREGGSLPCNVNVSNYGGPFGVEQSLFLHEIKNNKQRRNAKVATAAGKECEKEITACTTNENNALNLDNAIGITARVPTGATNCGDFVIEVEEPLIDIQQKQHIFQCKAQDVLTPGPPYYERLENLEKRIPRANMISPHTKADFATTCSTSYIDEPVRFNTLERGKPNDTKYLPLNEDYVSCKSVLGEKSELVKTPTAMFSTTKTITRQFDENGNSLNEVYQTGTQAALMNASLGSINSSAIGALGQAQAKGKSKKKSHQDRNTKTVNVETLAGFRGADPVEELVKYIESSEDKQLDSKNNTNKFNDTSKKKDRKKEKNHKIKKSNSLEELSSRAKIEVVDLKRTAATTETNLMMPNKNNKSKPNSSSSVDINRNFESTNSKDITSVNKTNNQSASRKCERRSWGTEELQYLEDNNNEERTKDKRNNKHKEKEKDTEKDKDMEKQKNKDINDQGDKTLETNDKSLGNYESTKGEKIEKADKVEKRKKIESNVFTVGNSGVTNILPVDSLLPETAEFHVVTKKKKPKKQRTSLDEAGGLNNNNVLGCNRTYNSVTNMQKPGAFMQLPQQNRNKYYYPHGSSASNERTDYSNSHNNPNHTQHMNNQQQSINTPRDKSRRKSTSSVPPSEKSDSSDLDSVHSLPIESTATNQQRHNSITQTDAPSIPNKATPNNGQSNSTLISYADIARTTKEVSVIIVSSEKIPGGETINVRKESEDVLAANSSQAPNTYLKPKAKKTIQRQDFPELVSSSANASTENIIKMNTFKTISYSQSLATTLSSTNTTAVFTICDSTPPATAITSLSTSGASHTKPQDPKSERRNVAIDNIKSEPSLSIDQSKQPQPLQKSKSVEYETYNYNSSNMDQQYPALEKTVKRHSAANVVTTTAIAPVVQFNFAAVAKQRLNFINEPIQKPVPISIPLETTTTSINAGANKAPINCGDALTAKTTSNETFSQNAFSCCRKNKKIFVNEKQPLSNTLAFDSIAIDSNSTAKPSTALYQSSYVEDLATSSTQYILNTHKHPDNKENHTPSSSINHVDVPTAAPSTAISNRPAVIILNDDRAVGASSEFTFGDFNEDEFKLFDDVTTEESNVANDLEFIVDCDVQQSQECVKKQPRVTMVQETNVLPIAAGVYLNDSGVSEDIVQRSSQNCDDEPLLTGVITSSPNSSCITSQSSNQSSDSGIYGLYKKSEEKHFSTAVKMENNVTVQSFYRPLKSVVVCDAAIKNEHRNTNDCCPPQHLETCNDIETAILAAARLAAEQQNYQQSQTFEVSNSSSNSSSFSSSSSVSIDYAQMGSYEPRQQNDDDMSCTSCQPHPIPSASLFVKTHHKELKVKFIDPAVASTINVLQNNEIIVDYIGSAWEEVLRSKMAVVYDGQ